MSRHAPGAEKGCFLCSMLRSGAVYVPTTLRPQQPRHNQTKVHQRQCSACLQGGVLASHALLLFPKFCAQPGFYSAPLPQRSPPINPASVVAALPAGRLVSHKTMPSVRSTPLPWGLEFAAFHLRFSLQLGSRERERWGGEAGCCPGPGSGGGVRTPAGPHAAELQARRRLRPQRCDCCCCCRGGSASSVLQEWERQVSRGDKRRGEPCDEPIRDGAQSSGHAGFCQPAAAGTRPNTNHACSWALQPPQALPGTTISTCSSQSLSLPKHHNHVTPTCPRLLLLAPEQRQQRHTRHLDHLEAHTGDITHGVAAAAETGDEHLVLQAGTKGDPSRAG